MSTREIAQEIVARWKCDIGQVVKYERMEADIDAALTRAIADERARCCNIVDSLATDIHMEMADAADIIAAIRRDSTEEGS